MKRRRTKLVVRDTDNQRVKWGLIFLVRAVWRRTWLKLKEENKQGLDTCIHLPRTRESLGYISQAETRRGYVENECNIAMGLGKTQERPTKSPAPPVIGSNHCILASFCVSMFCLGLVRR